jgi:hypothetical protein
LSATAPFATGCSSANGANAAAASESGAPSVEDGGASCVLCGDVTDTAPLAVQVRGAIDRSCASIEGCHGSGVGGLGLYPGGELQSLIGVPSVERPELLRVRPGAPLESYVYLKLRCDGGIDGGCMPLSSPPDSARAQLFFDWIEAGAPLP